MKKAKKYNNFNDYLSIFLILTGIYLGLS